MFQHTSLLQWSGWGLVSKGGKKYATVGWKCLCWSGRSPHTLRLCVSTQVFRRSGVCRDQFILPAEKNTHPVIKNSLEFQTSMLPTSNKRALKAWHYILYALPTWEESLRQLLSRSFKDTERQFLQTPSSLPLVLQLNQNHSQVRRISVNVHLAWFCNWCSLHTESVFTSAPLTSQELILKLRQQE